MSEATLAPQPVTAERFGRLAARWKSERGPTSSITEMALHPAYQEIVGMGPAAVSLLLRELEHAPDHWFWALKSITGIDPVAPEHRGNLQAMADDWIKWGREQGYRW